jgi:hypothetical protein
MMAPVSTTDPWVTVEKPAFVPRFLLARETDIEKTVANVDALVDLPDGFRWALTVLTGDDSGACLGEGDPRRATCSSSVRKKPRG